MVRALRGLDPAPPAASPASETGPATQSLDGVVQSRVQKEIERQQWRKLNFEKLNSELLLREADELIRRQRIAPMPAIDAAVVEKEKAVASCYRASNGRSLDCWKEVEDLKAAVADAQKASVLFDLGPCKSNALRTQSVTHRLILTRYSRNIVVVKWAGKKFDVDLDASESGLVFKTQLFALTGVAPDRQKILIKGGTLKDDTDMASLGIKEVLHLGHAFMMMGTVGELPKAPTEAVKFAEDLTDAQLAKALKVPAGLTNLGNTCYMNATLQCLRAVPELQTSLKSLPPQFTQDARLNLAKSLGGLYSQLENSGDAVTPLVFLQMLRSNFQQFAEQNNHGFMQQDAEECWGEIMSVLAEKAPGFTLSGDVDESAKFIDQYFTGETVSTMTCVDDPSEPPKVEYGTFRQLKANIGSGVSTYMLTDLESNFVETIEKTSERLGRTASYKKVTKITRLPAYLTVNFVRFQWKPSERVKAKILKRVKFPFDLDVSSLCHISLLEKLGPAKLHLKKLEEEKAAAKKAAKASGSTSSAMEVDSAEGTSSSSTTQAILASLNVDPSLTSSVGCNVSGQYELVAVLTHVGRGANSGHYIGWARNDKGEWWKFDDDTVSLVNEEEVTKLEGGGGE
ncbi:Ubiquitin carboxyl-terminal hydrolase 14 [Entophlyctis luteolus]|nr:Ubiquitin carboxyl-terminal hydrolase 14 [Entophlyctis luteolus]